MPVPLTPTEGEARPLAQELLGGTFSAYVAHPDYAAHLLHEIGGADAVLGGLVLRSGPPLPASWAQNAWLDARVARFGSIREAASILRSIQRNWARVPTILHRRAALIEAELPPLSAKPRAFPFELPSLPMGGWALLDAGTMVYSPRCSSPFPNGRLSFIENKVDPPSRAYLKLQEALSLCGSRPRAGQRCIDAGACPGGWTWVLRQLEAEVSAIDRSELDPGLMADPGVNFIKHSAFTLSPTELGPCDWLVSDVICYPAKLLEWIRSWLESGLCRNFICTVKMQGEPDWESIEAFRAIPGSRLIHLWHNKHELTWIKTESKA